MHLSIFDIGCLFIALLLNSYILKALCGLSICLKKESPSTRYSHAYVFRIVSYRFLTGSILTRKSCSVLCSQMKHKHHYLYRKTLTLQQARIQTKWYVAVSNPLSKYCQEYWLDTVAQLSKCNPIWLSRLTNERSINVN